MNDVVEDFAVLLAAKRKKLCWSVDTRPVLRHLATAKRYSKGEHDGIECYRSQRIFEMPRRV